MRHHGREASRTATAVGALIAALALLVLVAAPVSASSPASGVMRTGLPNHALTPGATNPAVTQATIQQTICVSGWTATIRPSSSYTNAIKVRQIAAYGFSDHRLASYEEDHLISLELGGSPRSVLNLWPEPRHIRLAGGTDVGSYAKDALENSLKRRVCAGTLTLASAQREIAGNWVAYWRLGTNVATTSPTPPPAPSPSPSPVATPTATPIAVDPIANAKAAGASAICRDGSWSYSAHRSGTCSRHGGVSWWTGNLGAAGPG